jgi:hypothetical protein
MRTSDVKSERNIAGALINRHPNRDYLGIHFMGVIFEGLKNLQGFVAVVSTNKLLRHKIVANLRPGRIVEQFA